MWENSLMVALALSFILFHQTSFSQIRTSVIEISGQVLNEVNKQAINRCQLIVSAGNKDNGSLIQDTLFTDGNGQWRTNLFIKERLEEIVIMARAQGFKNSENRFFLGNSSPSHKFIVGLRPEKKGESSPVERRSVTQVVYFSEGQENFREEFADDLLGVKAYADQFDFVDIHLHCFVGKWEKGGRKLAKKRGEAVKNFLIACGMNADRIHIFSRGYRDAIFDKPQNAREEAFNRRVGISFPNRTN